MSDRILPTRVITEPIADNTVPGTIITYIVTRTINTDGTIRRRIEVHYRHPSDANIYIKAWDNDAIPTGAGSVGQTARAAVVAALAATKTDWGF